jgi:enamine deaminase RidA (YjgF/YER057c/UK114 family)
MLESAGSSLDRIDKLTVVLAGAGDYDEMNVLVQPHCSGRSANLYGSGS